MTTKTCFRQYCRAVLLAHRLVPWCLGILLLAGTARPDVWRFAVVADTRGDGASTPADPWVNTPVLAAMATAIKNDQPDLVLIPGDLICGNAGSLTTNLATQYAAWTNAMAPVYNAGIRVYPVRGNHETNGDDASGTAFLAAFSNSLPGNGPDGEIGLTYSFAHKRAWFIGLDQYRTPHAVNQEWLTDQFALHTRSLVFVFGHEPAVQVSHTDCLAVNQTGRNNFINSLTEAGGLFYFCGHDHFYNRALVTAPNKRTFSQIVVGSGGGPFRNWSGVYGADFGEGDMAVNLCHVGFTNGYSLVTVSNCSVIIEWKGSADLVTWQTMDTAQYDLPNPAVRRMNDYDGDSKSDLAFYNESIGYWTVLFSSRNYTEGLQPILGGIGWRPAPGDYDGDGKTDVAVMNKDGDWWILLSGSNNLPVSTNFGINGAGPVAADYDGDGLTDIAYYEESSGQWGIAFSSGQSATASWGGPGFIPAPADFDGDGKADPCLYQPSSGAWYILFSSYGYLMASAIWGGADDQPLPVDFDNDGLADLCVYNNGTSEWKILFSAFGYTPYSFIWGNSAYKPVPGDYDGDGLADPVIYAGNIPDWSLLLSGSGYGYSSLPYGGTNWLAVQAQWREDLVFMAFGDSITYGDCSLQGDPSTGYPMLLETKLKQYFNGYFYSINKGEGGESTYDGFERFAAALDETDPDLVLLMEGTNDHFYGYPYDEIEENLRNMVATALSRGIPVIIGTIAPVISNAYRNRSEQMARISGFNPRIYAIAADYNIPVARVFESITAVPGWESRLIDQPTANHPNDAGYQVVRDAFYAAVSAGLRAGQF